MATHVYALLKEREIAACIEQARQAVHEWERGWCAVSGLNIDCLDAETASQLKPAPSGGQWTAYGANADSALWIWNPAGFDKQMEHQIFLLGDAGRSADRRRDSDVAGAVMLEALADLQASLVAHIVPLNAGQQLTGEAPPAWLFRRSAGSALLQLTLGGKSMSLLIPHSQLATRAGERAQQSAKRAPVTPLSTALTHVRTKLTAELGEVELSLGSLATLAIGDVITLSSVVDQPLKLYSGPHRLMGLGYLGKQDGHRAVEIFAVPQK